MVCNVFAGIDRLDLPEQLFGPEAFIPEQVLEKRHGATATGGLVDGLPWLHVVPSCGRAVRRTAAPALGQPGRS